MSPSNPELASRNFRDARYADPAWRRVRERSLGLTGDEQACEPCLRGIHNHLPDSCGCAQRHHPATADPAQEA